jgi:putative transposase
MKESRFTEEQIIGILKQHEAAVKTADMCREHGVSAATFYGWESKFRRHGRERGAAAAADGRREPTAEATGCRSEPR